MTEPSEDEKKIIVSKLLLSKRTGRPTTIQARRKAKKTGKTVDGKVTGNRLHYSDKEKMNAVCVFAVSGNSRRVAELTNIPEGTIRAWKCTEWWNDLLTRIHVEEDEELDTSLTKLVNKAVQGVNDRLDDGDWVYNPKLDKLIRKPVNAKDLAIVTAITIDKRQLLRGQPTQRVEKISQDERLNKLAEQFKHFALSKDISKESKVVVLQEAEIIEEEYDDEEPQTINEMFSEEA